MKRLDFGCQRQQLLVRTRNVDCVSNRLMMLQRTNLTDS